MSLSKEQIEHLYALGKMPNWAYYQLNKESAQTNYNKQKSEIMLQIQQRYVDDKLWEELQETIYTQLETVFKDIFRDFIQ